MCAEALFSCRDAKLIGLPQPRPRHGHRCAGHTTRHAKVHEKGDVTGVVGLCEEPMVGVKGKTLARTETVEELQELACRARLMVIVIERLPPLRTRPRTCST